MKRFHILLVMLISIIIVFAGCKSPPSDDIEIKLAPIHEVNVNIAESYPEQVFFTYKPGRTRDLRPHVYVFALRSNVKWSVKRGR